MTVRAFIKQKRYSMKRVNITLEQEDAEKAIKTIRSCASLYILACGGHQNLEKAEKYRELMNLAERMECQKHNDA